METPEVTINLRLNGPLLVTGPARLIDHEGNVFNLEGKANYALCRCGQSKRRPFCDGTHKTCGWVAEDKAV